MIAFLISLKNKHSYLGGAVRGVPLEVQANAFMVPYQKCTFSKMKNSSNFSK